MWNVRVRGHYNPVADVHVASPWGLSREDELAADWKMQETYRQRQQERDRRREASTVPLFSPERRQQLRCASWLAAEHEAGSDFSWVESVLKSSQRRVGTDYDYTPTTEEVRDRGRPTRAYVYPQPKGVSPCRPQEEQRPYNTSQPPAPLPPAPPPQSVSWPPVVRAIFTPPTISPTSTSSASACFSNVSTPQVFYEPPQVYDTPDESMGYLCSASDTTGEGRSNGNADERFRSPIRRSNTLPDMNSSTNSELRARTSVPRVRFAPPTTPPHDDDIEDILMAYDSTGRRMYF